MAFCLWFGAGSFWLRGAAVANATAFGYVNSNGFANYAGHYAAYSIGVCPRFSI